MRSVLIAVGKKSKRCLGYAFLDFVSAEAATAAVAQFDGLIYDGRPLNSNLKDEKLPPSKKKPRVEQNTVFLANLEASLTEEELSTMCDDILGPGLVVSVERPVDKATGFPRSFAFIEFVDVATVERAKAELQDLEVLGRRLSCLDMKRPSIPRIK